MTALNSGYKRNQGVNGNTKTYLTDIDWLYDIKKHYRASACFRQREIEQSKIQFNPLSDSPR